MKLIAVLASCAAAVLLPSTASAGWSPPVPFLAKQAPGTQALAAPDGSAVVRYVNSAAIKMPGESFGELRLLGDPQPFRSELVAMSMGESGRTLIVWGSQHEVLAAVREPGARSFSFLGPVFRAVPDVSYQAPITDVAAAVGNDDRLYLAYTDTTGANLATSAPGTTSFTRIAQFGSTIPEPANPESVGSYPQQVALATDRVGGVSFFVPRAVDRTLRTTLFQWSPATGPSALVDITADDYKAQQGDQPGYQTTSSYPTGVSGDRPTFFWIRERSRQEGPPPSEAWADRSLMKLELTPGHAPPAPIATETYVPQAWGGLPRVTVATDARGVGVVGWLPYRSQKGADPVTRLVQRTAPAGSFGAPVLFPGESTDQTDGPETPVLANTTGGSAQLFRSSIDGRNFGLFMSGIDGAGQVTPRAPFGGMIDITENKGVTAAGNGTGDTLLLWASLHRPGGTGGTEAFFYDVNPPSLTAAVAATAPEAGGIRVDLTASARDTWTPTTVTWTFEDGSTTTGPTVSRRFAAGAAVRVVATATDAGGNTSSSVIAGPNPLDLQVQNERAEPGAPPTPAATAAAAPAAVPTPTPTTARTTSVSPSVTGLKVTNKRFRATTKRPSAGRGTILSFSLPAAAKVELVVQRKAKGYRRGTSCVAKRPRSGAIRRCSLDRTVQTIRADGRAGLNRIAFGGAVGKRLLAPGTYALRVTTTAAGTTPGRTATIHVVIRR